LKQTLFRVPLITPPSCYGGEQADILLMIPRLLPQSVTCFKSRQIATINT